jgi:hypothetical protein
MALGKFLTVDPGEMTGWSLWNDTELLDSGMETMWAFSDSLWEAAVKAAALGVTNLIEPDELADTFKGINRIVCEDWRLYPWELSNLSWDECRTARLIGSITAACRFTGWTLDIQPAKIKKRALAAGAESYFSHPLYENRHANDAIMHGVFRNAIEAGAPWTDLSTMEWDSDDA